MSGAASGQTPGALYELIARGEKDKYFFAEANQGAFSPFASQYVKTAAHISETKMVDAVNDTRFGGTAEFEVERFADILTSAWLVIQLPAIVGAEYVAGAGFFLIDKLQILQGQMIISECTGEVLYLTTGMRQLGVHAELERELGSGIDARVRIPFPGCQVQGQQGFPLCAVPDKGYKIRVTFRKLAHLLVGVGVGSGGSGPSQHSLSVRLELTEAYIPLEVRQGLREATIPFTSWTTQTFQLRADGRRPYLIEGRNLSEGLIVYAREKNPRSLLDISSTVIAAMEMTVSGREREAQWTFRDMWGTLQDHAKNASPWPVPGIAQINWSLGDIFRGGGGGAGGLRRPEGTLNFTEADKPILYLTPAASYRADPPVMVTVAQEGWRVYEIREGGYGRVMFV